MIEQLHNVSPFNLKVQIALSEEERNRRRATRDAVIANEEKVTISIFPGVTF